MRITLLPKTGLGKAALVLSIIFIIIFSLKITNEFIPLPAFAVMALGVAGFILGITAVIKKDRAAGTFLPIVVGLGIIAVLVAVGINSVGLFKEFKVKSTLTAEEAGNESGVVMNLGWISQSDGWIYYLKDNNLYKIRTDWTEKTKVSDSELTSLYIFGKWIYYTDSFDIKNLYKMKTDGTSQAKLSDDYVDNFTVSGECIYYSTIKDMKSQTGAGALYKIKNDGSNKVRISDLTGSPGNPIKVFDNYVYFMENGNLYRTNLNGTEKILVCEDSGMGIFMSGGMIYCLNVSDDGKARFYKVNPDGSEKVLIKSLDNIYNYTFDSDWLYFTKNSTKGLYRMNLDGTGEEKLNNITIWSLTGVSGNWVYIEDYGGPSFRVKLDGSFGTRIK